MKWRQVLILEIMVKYACGLVTEDEMKNRLRVLVFTYPEDFEGLLDSICSSYIKTKK